MGLQPAESRKDEIATTMITNLDALREKLIAINDEISVVTPFHTDSYQAGLVAFQPRQNADEKWITHDDAEVISYVLEGQGQLQLPDEDVPLTPGIICHIPVNVPHDFVAQGKAPLVMFYISIKVGKR